MNAISLTKLHENAAKDSLPALRLILRRPVMVAAPWAFLSYYPLKGIQVAKLPLDPDKENNAARYNHGSDSYPYPVDQGHVIY